MRQFAYVAFAAVASCAMIDDGPATQSVPLRTHILRQPYVDSEMQSRWWDFGGDAIIRADAYVRLAPDKPSRAGFIYSTTPISASSWEIEVEFKVHGEGALHGDGFAMWLTKQRAVQGPVFGAVDKFEGLGIFFDTYKNNRPGVTFPYIMAMLGDGQTAYDKEHDGKANELAGCTARNLRFNEENTRAKLTYAKDNSLVLQMMYDRNDGWQKCFNLPNVKLPSLTYLGFTAETGELHDNHDIISVETKNLWDSPDYASTKSSQNNFRKKAPLTEPRSGGGWLWFFFKMILFFGLIAGGYVGYTVYRSQKKPKSRF